MDFHLYYGPSRLAFRRPWIRGLRSLEWEMGMKIDPNVARPTRRLRVALGILAAAALALAAGATASELEDVLDAGAENVRLAQASQQRIDAAVLETENLESEYKQVVKQVDGLKVYNEYMERQLAGQRAELDELHRSIEQIGTVERQIMPLMMRMFDGLEQFVDLDLPFLKEERLQRIERLRAVMERSDVTVAEKFRRLTEAFQVENDFGRTIETYKDALEIDGVTLEVDVLRLGRVGLYYQTYDAGATGHWDPEANGWKPLTGGDARNQVRRGIRIARRLVAPDLLLVDVPAPEVAP